MAPKKNIDTGGNTEIIWLYIIMFVRTPFHCLHVSQQYFMKVLVGRLVCSCPHILAAYVCVQMYKPNTATLNKTLLWIKQKAATLPEHCVCIDQTFLHL